MCMKLFSLVFISVVSIPAAVSLSASAATTVDIPVHKLGDMYEYDINATVRCKKWQVSNLNSHGSLLSTCGDYIMYESAANGHNLQKITDSSGKVFVEFIPFFPGISFPVTVGKQWSGKYVGYTRDNGARWNSNVTCTAKAIEKIKIAGIKVDAVRVECADKWAAGAYKGVGRSTRWYSPDTKSLVRVLNDGDSRWDMTLQRFHLK